MKQSSFFLSDHKQLHPTQSLPPLAITINSSLKAYGHLKNHISYTQEEVWVICLNNLKIPLSTQKIFVGSVDFSPVHPREIMKEVILAQSSSFILCHSHPSGDPTPSQEDILVTTRFLKISELLQIKLDDHIIYSRNSYFSFLDHDMI